MSFGFTGSRLSGVSALSLGVGDTGLSVVGCRLLDSIRRNSRSLLSEYSREDAKTRSKKQDLRDLRVRVLLEANFKSLWVGLGIRTKRQ